MLFSNRKNEIAAIAAAAGQPHEANKKAAKGQSKNPRIRWKTQSGDYPQHQTSAVCTWLMAAIALTIAPKPIIKPGTKLHLPLLASGEKYRQPKNILGIDDLGKLTRYFDEQLE